MSSTAEERVEIAEYWRIVWKRKWMILLPTALVLATAWIALHFVTPYYVSHALIAITDRDAVQALADEFADQGGRRGGDRRRAGDYAREKLGQLNQQVTGQRFIGPVGKRLGLDVDPTILTAAENMQARLPDLTLDELVTYAYTARLKPKIWIEPAGISLYKFKCKDEDPLFAYALARAVSDEFLNYTLGEGIEVVDRTQEFSSEQLERYQELLKQAEDALQAKQRQLQNRALSSQNPITEGNFAETRRLVDEADLEIITLERRIQRGVERLPADVGGTSSIRSKANSARLRSLASALNQAERNQVPLIIQGLAAGSVSGVVGSEVTNTRTELFAEIQTRVEKAFPRESLSTQQQARDVLYDQMTLESVRARRSRIRELLGQYSAGVAAAPAEQLELRRLQEDVDRYRQLVANIQERRITDDLHRYAQEASVSSRVKIIEPPAVPIKPAWPDRFRILLFAALAGPLLGLGAVILAEYMDNSLRTVEEIEHELGLPVLGTIPRLVPVNLKGRRRRANRRHQHAGMAGAWLLFCALDAAWAAGTPLAEPEEGAQATTDGELIRNGPSTALPTLDPAPPGGAYLHPEIDPR
jgi:uncharacterized protein involved in exopolysaccharide biosynthesis